MASRQSSNERHPQSQGDVPSTAAMLRLAKRVTTITNCPVVGGLAVVLHGYSRTTNDIDIYSKDLPRTHAQLLEAGVPWNARRREHTIDGVPIHLVSDELFGEAPSRTSTIRGVKVIGLRDLIRAKLESGLESVARAQDIADVVELIRAVPLRKDFAAKLPTRLRAPFKQIVEQVHGPRRTALPPLGIWKRKLNGA